MSEAIPGLELMNALTNQSQQGLQAMQYGIQNRQNERQLTQTDRRLNMEEQQYNETAPQRQLANKTAQLMMSGNYLEQKMKSDMLQFVATADDAQTKVVYNTLQSMQNSPESYVAGVKRLNALGLDPTALWGVSSTPDAKSLARIKQTQNGLMQTYDLVQESNKLAAQSAAKEQEELFKAKIDLKKDIAKMNVKIRGNLNDAEGNVYNQTESGLVFNQAGNQVTDPTLLKKLKNNGGSVPGVQNIGATVSDLNDNHYPVMGQGLDAKVLTPQGYVPLQDYTKLNPSATLSTNKTISPTEIAKRRNAAEKGAVVVRSIDEVLNLADQGVALSHNQLANSVSTLVGGAAETLNSVPLIGNTLSGIANATGISGDQDSLENLSEDIGGLDGAPQVLMANTIVAVADSMGGGTRVITKDNIKNARASLGLPAEGSMKEIFQNTTAVTQKLAAARILQQDKLRDSIAGRIDKTYNMLTPEQQVEVNNTVSQMVGKPISGGEGFTPQSTNVDMNKFPQQGLVLPQGTARLLGVPSLTRDQFMALPPQDKARLMQVPSINKQFR
jgi:hypothetical protein